MKNCIRCGAQLADGMQFCGNCGAQQTEQPVYQQPVYQQPAHQVSAKVPGRGMGVASMVLGIISLVFFCIWYIAVPCAIVGVSLGGLSKSKANEVGASAGMANAGVACSCIALGLALLFILLVSAGVASAGYMLEDLFY